MYVVVNSYKLNCLLAFNNALMYDYVVAYNYEEFDD